MTGSIHIGVGGWTFEPWRGVFYPEGLTQKRELEFASRALTSIEINGTYYSTFKPDSWMKWRDETPDGFVFAAGHQAGVGEVGGGLVDLGPGRGFVVDGIDDGRAVLAGQVIELGTGEGRVANLQGVTQPHPVFLAGQQFQKALEILGVELLRAHTLPH